ncbi:nucleotidyltransferase family protein [Zhongshania sp. BJYM1]|jgi:molybdenum cofactor cytidylyltransferase|uniref:nucleotidyltransferase family protein n=1 Tax=Zhongshania aquatica TaxID=2965069 RepID=UPI0022B501A5|nr:nucleotidyltransferase family protein [Marortus sp. BJYM1]
MIALPLVILAAGKSKRFGVGDKRFTILPHGGVLVNAMVRRGRRAGLDVYVALDASDDVSEKIDAPCLFAKNASSGMGATIADTLSELAALSSADAVLIMPVDLPLIRVKSLRCVAERASLDRIVMPQHNGRRGHPVAFGRQYWPALMKLSGDEGARSMISSNVDHVDMVELDDEGIYLDADTPEEMEVLMTKLRPTLR